MFETLGLASRVFFALSWNYMIGIAALDGFVDYLISKLGRVYDYIARTVVNSVFKDSAVQESKQSEKK